MLCTDPGEGIADITGRNVWKHPLNGPLIALWHPFVYHCLWSMFWMLSFQWGPNTLPLWGYRSKSGRMNALELKALEGKIPASCFSIREIKSLIVLMRSHTWILPPFFVRQGFFCTETWLNLFISSPTMLELHDTKEEHSSEQFYQPTFVKDNTLECCPLSVRYAMATWHQGLAVKGWWDAIPGSAVRYTLQKIK